MTSSRARLILIIVGAFLLSGLFAISIFHSTSSTAPVGFLFLPVTLGLGALAGYLVWFVGTIVVDLKEGEVSLASFRVLAAVLLVISALSFANRYIAEKGYLEEARSLSTHSDRFWDFHRQRFVFQEHSIRAAVAENPSTPSEVLEVMAKQGVLLPAVGKHPRLPSKIVEEIAGGEFSYYRMAGVAANPNLSISLMQRMVHAELKDFPDQTHFNLYQVYVLAILAGRSNIPQNLFDELAAREPLEYFLAHALLRSEKIKCPQAQKLVSHENENVIRLAEKRLKEKGCS